MLELRPVSYDHPDAQELTERAQAYYVELYGGRDEDPLTAAEFERPRGGFVVGYLDGAPVAMGGWSLTASDLGDRVAKIRRMYVDATVRRQGLARAVLGHLETEAAGHGVTMIILRPGGRRWRRSASTGVTATSTSPRSATTPAPTRSSASASSSSSARQPTS